MSLSGSASVVSTLTSRLRSARNADGGWPYYSGKSSRLEPTAWALLALDAAGQRVDGDPLVTWPRRDGWFLDADAVNIAFNGLAAVTLAQRKASAGAVSSLRTALVGAKGLKLGKSTVNRQDNSLQGWAWTEDTFSWVEPTAWGLLALKRTGTRDSGAQQRIVEAERLLLDRVCRLGGWNFGNSNMLGTELAAHAPTSALGLISLSDRKNDEPIQRTLKFVSAHRLEERSAMALGLTRIALGLFGVASDDVIDALHEEWSRTAFLGNLHVTAVALYAEIAATNGFEAFRV